MSRATTRFIVACERHSGAPFGGACRSNVATLSRYTGRQLKWTPSTYLRKKAMRLEVIHTRPRALPTNTGPTQLLSELLEESRRALLTSRKTGRESDCLARTARAQKSTTRYRHSGEGTHGWLGMHSILGGVCCSVYTRSRRECSRPSLCPFSYESSFWCC